MINGDGLSEIVALIILVDDAKPVIESVDNIFKKYNHLWGKKTAVIMSDKDFNKRDAFSNCFSSAKLLLCLYHTLRSLRGETTCEKMGITSAEQSSCITLCITVYHYHSQFICVYNNVINSNLRDSRHI